MRHFILFLSFVTIMSVANARDCSFEERQIIYNEIKNPSNEYTQDAKTKANGLYVAASLIEESFGAKCKVLDSTEVSSNTVTEFLVTTTNKKYKIVHSFDNEGGYTNNFTIRLIK